MKRASPPALPTSRSVSSASTSLTSPNTTRAPSCAKRTAVARPIPVAAPVITATFPSSRKAPSPVMSPAESKVARSSRASRAPTALLTPDSSSIVDRAKRAAPCRDHVAVDRDRLRRAQEGDHVRHLGRIHDVADRVAVRHLLLDLGSLPPGRLGPSLHPALRPPRSPR